MKGLEFKLSEEQVFDLVGRIAETDDFIDRCYTSILSEADLLKRMGYKVNYFYSDKFGLRYELEE